MRGRPQERPVEFHEAETTAAGEQRLVTLGQCRIARAVRNHQADEERLDERQEFCVLFDEVDEDRGVEPDGTGAEVVDQSQDRRSRAT